MTTPLGNRTEEVMKLRAGGMSVKDIASKFGVTKATVYNDLKGSRPKMKDPSNTTAKRATSTVRVSINDSFAVSSNVPTERVKQILGLLID